MKGLLIKDLILSKKIFISEIIICAVLLILMVVYGITSYGEVKSDYSDLNGILTVLFGVCGPALLGQTLYADESCGFMAQSFSSPKMRKDYIKEKYVFSLMSIIIFLVPSLIAVALCAGFAGADGYADGIIWLLKLVGIVLAVQLFSCTFMICYYVKIGAASMVISLIVLLFIATFDLAFVSGFVAGYSEAAENQSLFSIYIIGIIVFFVSLEIFLFFMSFRWAERKEV